jgi:hypothetical protein
MVNTFKCGNALNNWRSDIGKAGHQAALIMLSESGKYPHDKEGCKKIIEDALYHLRFIYEKPDDEVSTCVHPMRCDIKPYADCVGQPWAILLHVYFESICCTPSEGSVTLKARTSIWRARPCSGCSMNTIFWLAATADSHCLLGRTRARAFQNRGRCASTQRRPWERAKPERSQP